MDLKPEHLLQLAATIWEAMLSLPIEPLTGGCDMTGQSMAGCVQITGAWNGAVLLDCPVVVARIAASAMFGMTEDDVTIGEMRDAVAELSNMVGGHVKALLPETCYLSLPTIINGGDYSARVHCSRSISRVNFACKRQVVTITVLAKVEEPVTL